MYLNQCEDCNYTINHRTAKIFMESCKNVTVTVSGQILTHTMEIWKCSGSTVYLKTGCKTIQLDLMEDMTLRFEDRDHMGAIVWQAVDDLKLRFDNDAGQFFSRQCIHPLSLLSVSHSSIIIHHPTTITDSISFADLPNNTEQDLDTGFAHMKEKYPDSVKEVDQYIIRHLGEEKVLTPERCIRLKNGFLSTDREAHDWEVRNEKIKHDYVERYLKEAGIHLRRSKEKVIPRNSPCPCGSGKKYKKCCINKRELTGVVSREEQLENASKPIQSGASIVDGQTRSADEVVEKAAEMLGEQLARQKLQQQQQQ